MVKKKGWYGVRTLYRTSPVGRPRGTDRLYSREVTLVEERVVVFRARSLAEAIRKAEAEAKNYTADWHRNPYGQRVRTSYLGYVDAYEMNDELVDGAEVFSETEVVSRKVADRAVAKRLVGQTESRRTFDLRRNILDIVFSAPAPGVRRTAREKAFIQKCAVPNARKDA